MYLSTSDGSVISHKQLEDIVTYLSKNRDILNKHIKNVKGIECIRNTLIKLDKGKVGAQFLIRNVDELHEFYDLSKKTVISNLFENFFNETKFELSPGFHSSTRFRFDIIMTEQMYTDAIAQLNDSTKDIR